MKINYYFVKLSTQVGCLVFFTHTVESVNLDLCLGLCVGVLACFLFYPGLLIVHKFLQV